MAERGVHVTHTSIMRWVHRYVPEFERRWSRFATPVGCSWRMDETSVSVRGRNQYLYRAVDRDGKTVHSSLLPDRGTDSARSFFREAVRAPGAGWPEKINLDGNAASHCALHLLGKDDPRWRAVQVRVRRYLNNIVEQDHRAIKSRCRPMLGLKSAATAAITLSGIELIHRIRKGQFALHLPGNDPAHSVQSLWTQVMSNQSAPGAVPTAGRTFTHQISLPRVRGSQPRPNQRRDTVRYARKVSFGHSLYQLITPRGGRLWRYKYHFEGREKLISLGRCPDVPLESARARHLAARRLLAMGIDPGTQRHSLRRIFA